MNIESLALNYADGTLRILDQRWLPHDEVWETIQSPEQMAEAIKELKVRGAPLIGVAAALSLAQFSRSHFPSLETLRQKTLMLREARPTAVNLMVAMDRMLSLISEQATLTDIEALAELIFHEDVELCEQISNHGQAIIKDGDKVLTICNTGALATAGRGTALGVISKAWESGKKLQVYFCETRPLLQGGRLTAWELMKLNIPRTLICDNMAAHLMSKGEVTKVIVGADRIALNGDFANKIGTYNLAVLCHYHKVPFYVAAPSTTLDPKTKSGKDIPIEQRTPNEVLGVSTLAGECRWAPSDTPVYNPSFDVTPENLVTGYILDSGFYLNSQKNKMFGGNT